MHAWIGKEKILPATLDRMIILGVIILHIKLLLFYKTQKKLSKIFYIELYSDY